MGPFRRIAYAPEHPTVIDDGVGAPVPVVIHEEQAAEAVDVDRCSVVVQVFTSLVLTKVLWPFLLNISTAFQCHWSRTTVPS